MEENKNVTIVKTIIDEKRGIPSFILLSNGNVIKIEHNEQPPYYSFRIYDSETEEFKFNSKGQLTYLKRLKYESFFEYDEQGRLVNSKEITPWLTSYRTDKYTETGKIVTETFKRKDRNDYRIEESEYDLNGRLISIKEQGEPTYIKKYNDKGDLIYYMNSEYGEAKAEYNEYGNIMYLEAKAYKSFSMPYLTSEFPLNDDEK